MEITYYGYNNKEYIFRRIKQSSITYFIISRNLVPKSVEQKQRWKKIDLVTIEGTLVPSTHHVLGTMYINDNIIAFHDLKLIFKIIANDDMTEMMVSYNWYYDETFPLLIIPEELKKTETLIPKYMDNLFINTGTRNIAYSGTVNIIIFENIPTIPNNISKDALTTFALSHLVCKYTKKTLIGDHIVTDTPIEGIIKTASPISSWSNVDPKIRFYTDTSESKILKDLNDISIKIEKLKYKEINLIMEEVRLSEIIMTKYFDILSISDLLDYKSKLKCINKKLNRTYLRNILKTQLD